MIETLSLRNFKVLRDVDIALRPFTLIVGPNSSGKSSLLQALQLVEGQWHTLQGRSKHLLSRSAQGFTTVTCSGVSRGMKLAIDLRLEEHSLSLTSSLGPNTFGISPRFSTPIGEPIQLRTALLKLDVGKLAAPSPPQPTLNLPNDGEGLASVLAGLLLEHLPRFQKLVEQLRNIVPSLINVRVRRVPAQQSAADELLFDMHGAEDIPAFAISDGTLLTLGLLTVLAVPDPPELILIEDLERGLHPKALGDLVSQLRRLQEQKPDLQIVATSHSPYLLDHFKAEEILLTSLDEEGYAAVKPLTDHPEYERWKELMAPGEFWSMVGEKWVAESEPKKTSASSR